ncbi:hypothetical protein CMQ_3614 [Grosmannia clavigera kw1407]|uniref:Uncharacterized protein n=1 Tax=Grosmannia clavigera (strain kw1407 / UAMH 11150) TaxID=655863 RepID=F0XA48_GROCL|nr:uncharacterized protein CMQ_3614 [Grosmannia clavigera kw1407]EFX05545.1 hypothetical protein CMQ_3614 [Grosmannia clavigera kw1407]
MASFDCTSSPILTMTPQSAHQGSLDRRFFPHPSASFGLPSSWTQGLGQAFAPPPRGRKRSRDEAAVNLDSPEKVPPPAETVKDDEDEWEYGPGMILIKKSSGYVHDASTQSGTWLEESAAALEAQRQEDALLAQRRQAQDRPSLRSHKSSRIDLSARASAQAGSSRTSLGHDLSDASSKTPSGAGSQPIIDDFTLHLGIGWSRLSEDEHIQAAARGWARYIEKHYPVTEPKILLESKGLESYLVEAREGFFLFGIDLHQGRLVSSDAQRTLANLKCNPPVFDGEHVITAAGTPRATGMGLEQSGAAQASADLDMDMN